MAVAEGLAAKVGLSLGAAGVGATGIYFGNNYLNDYVYISKYERALIEFLNDDEGNDIVFEVKKGESGNEDLGSDDITFSATDGTSPIKVKVKVTADSTFSYLRRENTSRDSDASNIDKIKQLGQDGNWTWECSFNFTLEGSLPSDAQIPDKDKIFKDSNIGLFGILKKDLSNYNGNGADGVWTRKNIKNVKADFIRQCGNQRLVSKNKELSQVDNKASDTDIKIEDTNIKFVSQGNNLVPKAEDKATFDYWFKERYKDVKYSAGS